jgi:hypothetical protein
MADLTEQRQTAPNQDNSLNRREMLRQTLGATGTAALAAAGFSSDARALAEETSTDLNRGPETQVEALRGFAETSAVLTVQIDALDDLMKSSQDRELTAHWKETREAVVAALNHSQETVVAELRRSYNRPGNESEHTDAFARTTESLTPHSESLQLLLQNLHQTHTPAEPPPKGDQLQTPETTPRRPGFRIDIGSPFEAALEETGIYQELAQSISRLARDGLIPLLDRVQTTEGGGLDLSSLNNKKWRSRLSLKRRSGRLQDVVPERIFEAVLEQASKEPAIRNIISRIDQSEHRDDARWQKTRERAEKTLAQSAELLEQGVSSLLEASRRPRPGGAKQEMAQIQGARAGLRTAHLLVEAHERVLQASSAVDTHNSSTTR